MRDKSFDKLTKLHYLQQLFSPITGNDPYMVDQLKKAIEFSVTGSIDESADMKNFADAAMELFEKYRTPDQSFKYFHLDLNNRLFDPLWFQNDLHKALKILSGYNAAFLCITGLRKSLSPKGKYWTRRTEKRYEKTLDFIDEFAAKWSTKNTKLTIICV